MELGVILTVIGTGATTVGLIYAFLRDFKIDIHDKIDRLENDVKADIRAQTARLDQVNARMDQFQQSTDQRMEQFQKNTDQRMEQFQQNTDQRLDQVNARMDQFQQMFYDLLKAQNPKTHP